MATKKATGNTKTTTKKSTTKTTKSGTKSTNTSKSKGTTKSTTKSKGTTKSTSTKSAKNKTASTKGTKSTSTKSTKSSTRGTSSNGEWKTINGVHVFIENGKVTKGPKNFIGKTRMQIKQEDYKNKEKQKKPITQTFKVKKETEYSGVLPYGYTAYHVYMTDTFNGEPSTSRIKEFETYKAAMDYVKNCRARSAKGLRYYGGQWYGQ